MDIGFLNKALEGACPEEVTPVRSHVLEAIDFSIDKHTGFYKDVDDLVSEFDYKPSMQVKKGVSLFVKWYKTHYNF